MLIRSASNRCGASGVASKMAVVSVGLLACLAPPNAPAAWPNLPTTPLATQVVGDPNMLLTLDDSGSMSWAYAPDSISGTTNQVYFLSPRVNAMAYDPFDVYELPYDPAINGNRLTTSFTSAYINGFHTARGVVNLSSSYRPVSVLDPKSSGSITYAAGPTATPFSAQAAFIYAFYNDLSPSGTLPAPGTDPATFVRNTTAPSGCPGLTGTTTAACYVKVVIAGNSTHEQNFANWYSFYKTRNLAVVSSANIAMYDLNPKFRVAWQTLSSCKGFNISGSCKGWDGVAVTNSLRPISSTTQKQNLYKFLSRLPAASNTPLRSAVQRAGTFITTTGIESPRANQPGTAENGPGTAPISACRANFHVLLTDGIWNNNERISVGNVDNTGIGSLPDGKPYTPQFPYKDTNSNSIADLAFQQWATDAQTGLTNSLTPYYPDSSNKNYWDPRNDPATWQHMNTYAIGLGLNGFLNGTVNATAGYLPLWGGNMYAGDYNALVAGTVPWPKTQDDSAGNVADLWHAAINGRGVFFGADSPSAVKEAFRSIFARANNQVTSGGQVTGTSRRVSAGSQTFDVSYTPADWYSTITAYGVYSDGTRGLSQWTTDATLLSDSPSRNLYTWDSASGQARTFAWTSFTTTEKASYFGTTGIPAGDQDLLNYLRGNRSQESIKFRRRVQLLGDVVGSDLLASAKTDQGYQFLASGSGGSSYAAFVNGKKSVIFVGANDGMLHGFSTTGQELFGYFPGAVLGKLKDLAKSPLVRQPLVDGPLTLGDAYLGGAWKTVLIAGLGGGGKTVVGIDVTSITQNSGSGTFSASNILFEVSDADMGYSYAKPVVGRTAKGDWVAIWGNGYGGATGRAVLFVYNLTTKTLSKVDTGVGSLTVGNENGMGSPAGIEFSSGNIVGVYAGDYQGNLWKFVLGSTGAFTASAGTTPFFRATDPGGARQPITAAPEAVLHPAGGTIVLFGTGKFFEAQDRSTRDVNTFYAVRDQGKAGTLSRSNLVTQTITAGTTAGSALRALSTNPIDYSLKAGWYVDLSTTLAAGGPSGERVVAKPILLNDLTVFATYTPGDNECEGAGTSYMMFVNAFTGGNLSPVFDSSGDGAIDSSDKPASGNNYAGMKVADAGGTLSSPIGSLVGLQPLGIRGQVASGQTCGTDGNAPCPGPVPAPGCMSGLIVKGGVCKAPSCQRGNVWAQAASSGACLISPEAKYPRWMELKWK